MCACREGVQKCTSCATPFLEDGEISRGIEMAVGIDDIPKRKVARIAGLLYLTFIVTFASSTFIQIKSTAGEDAARTARSILASQWLFRIGFMSEVVAAFLFLLAAWALYVLLKSVSKSLALLFLLLNLVGVAVECTLTVIHFAALLLLRGDSYLNVFSPDQLQALAMFFLNLGGSGNMILTLFYGAWLFPLGYLILKSGFLPRALGILIFLDGFSVLICFFQLCLFPGHEKLLYPLYPVMFIAEFGLGLWLLIMGVKVEAQTG
jgi:hypothetical protein